MQAVMLALLLALASSARAEEPPKPAAEAAPKDAPKVHVVSEKEMVDDDGYVVRLSLPTETDVAAWSHPGVRIALAYSHGELWGKGPAATVGTNALTIRALARIDRWWSVGLDFQYAVAGSKTLSGLRYATNLDAMLHATERLAFTLGAGLGGFYALRPLPGAPAVPVPGSGAEVSNVTFGQDVPFGSCSGAAWTGVGRAEYLFIAGQLFATGPFLEADAQYTLCTEPLNPRSGSIDKETGLPIAARQWWVNGGLALGWWFTWR